MTDAGDIEAELQAQGYDTGGIISVDPKKRFYAVGFAASDLPDEVEGYAAISDPSLNTR